MSIFSRAGDAITKRLPQFAQPYFAKKKAIKLITQHGFVPSSTMIASHTFITMMSEGQPQRIGVGRDYVKPRGETGISDLIGLACIGDRLSIGNHYVIHAATDGSTPVAVKLEDFVKHVTPAIDILDFFRHPPAPSRPDGGSSPAGSQARPS